MKKIIVLYLLLVALCLAGCSGDSTKMTDNEINPNSVAQEPQSGGGNNDAMQLETARSIDTSVEQVYLVDTCADEDWQQISELPYQEDVGTITQYRNFIRGIYELSSQKSYMLDVSWHEDSQIKFYCIGQNGHQEEFLLSSNNPIEIKVPEDGLYRIQAPLNGESITKLYFSLSVSE